LQSLRAEVSPRTFFNYYATKDDAILGFDPRSGTDLAVALLARPSGESASQAVRAILMDRAAEMTRDTELWRLRMKVVDANPSLAARLASGFGESERALAEAIAIRTDTRVDVDVYPSLLAAVQGVVMRTSLHRWLAGEFASPLPDLVDEAGDVLISGLREPTA